MDSQTIFGRRGAVVQAQSILFNNALDHLERAMAALSRAAELAISSGVLSKFIVRYGDCSPFHSIDAEGEARLRKAAQHIHFAYHPFNENLGSARGHNRLAEMAGEDVDFLWVQNPDVIVAPRLFEQVMAPFSLPGVGQVEAKQLPIEHPKDYNPVTGETDWTSTACVMTPLSLFRALNGFDADTFFLYCDDVDLSFRIRELGLRLIFQPAAICFHDKRLSDDGAWQPSTAEKTYSAEAGLMMAHKWSYPDRLEEILRFFQNSSEPHLQRAADVFAQRKLAGTLPQPRDPHHKVAKFHGDFYTRHRFLL
jgi:GT2 family glycosyltransferase